MRQKAKGEKERAKEKKSKRNWRKAREAKSTKSKRRKEGESGERQREKKNKQGRGRKEKKMAGKGETWVSKGFHWEAQVESLCGQRVLHALAGSDVFTQTGLDQSAEEVQDIAARDGFKLKITDLKHNDGDYNMDVLLRAASQTFDLNSDEEPIALQFYNKAMLRSKLSAASDLLVLENDNHWLAGGRMRHRMSGGISTAKASLL
jgi:hypothetical protein